MVNQLRTVLRLEKEWNCCIIGVGRLGRAGISYPGFTPEGFNIRAAFDDDVNLVGQTVGGLSVQPINELEKTIRDKNISIGILTVPAKNAQIVIDRMVESGLKSIPVSYTHLTLPTNREV